MSGYFCFGYLTLPYTIMSWKFVFCSLILWKYWCTNRWDITEKENTYVYHTQIILFLIILETWNETTSVNEKKIDLLKSQSRKARHHHFHLWASEGCLSYPLCLIPMLTFFTFYGLDKCWFSDLKMFFHIHISIMQSQLA